ncbi:Hypothetical Protein FCC1311_100522 [Hondaea fermentalgiana]|uniref:Uncharacterized protein n=1 Tax=Hondaea fermentalgiana TaxID=2315210 RepID=A0A2R5GU30_9STRA|nr:Hypothetical Protein FCC1311_100522 [Hondaea fermentalgiana]|eukprot:GBG33829.1 Hypothetical Protein FCC1311_100522 [Hondaea fermentalgiana]
MASSMIEDNRGRFYAEGKDAGEESKTGEQGVTTSLQKQYASAHELCLKILRVEPENNILLEYKIVLEQALKEKLGADTESESDDSSIEGDDNESLSGSEYSDSSDKARLESKT